MAAAKGEAVADAGAAMDPVAPPPIPVMPDDWKPGDPIPLPPGWGPGDGVPLPPAAPPPAVPRAPSSCSRVYSGSLWLHAFDIAASRRGAPSAVIVLFDRVQNSWSCSG